MNFEEARQRLSELCNRSTADQQARSKELNEAFDIYWASNPTRAEFGETCRGMLVTPEMLWTMAKQ